MIPLKTRILLADDHALVRRQRHHALEPLAHAVLARPEHDHIPDPFDTVQHISDLQESVV